MQCSLSASPVGSFFVCRFQNQMSILIFCCSLWRGFVFNNDFCFIIIVPPQAISLRGPTTVKEGEQVTLTCIASHANPAANITWFNSSVPVDDQPQSAEMIEENGVTFRSASNLKFTATRFDDEEKFSCQAANQAMDDNRLNPLEDVVTLTVLCKYLWL